MHGENRMDKGFQEMDRLQRLVFSFYREDPQMQLTLEPLRLCRMRRNWGGSCGCLDAAHLERVSALLGHLRPPLAALGLGRRRPGRGASAQLSDVSAVSQHQLDPLAGWIHPLTLKIDDSQLGRHDFCRR